MRFDPQPQKIPFESQGAHWQTDVQTRPTIIAQMNSSEQRVGVVRDTFCLCTLFLTERIGDRTSVCQLCVLQKGRQYGKQKGYQQMQHPCHYRADDTR